MPILHVRALPQKDDVDIPRVLSALCTQVAAVMEVDARQVWATWETLQPGHYVEGDTPAVEQPHSTHPPIVQLIAFEGRPQEVIDRMILTAADTLSRELGLESGNAFITFVETLSGRTYTGGQIRRKTP